MKKAISLFLALVMLVSVFAGLGITAYAADAQTLWVDPVNGSDSAAGTQVAPFQTIEKAKAAAAALSAGGDVTVWLHGGTYRVSNAITFTSADSGKNGHVITYKAVSGEVPVISGGTPITGWTIYDAQKNIYVADVPAAAVNSRQFYVDGEHQTRAMTEQSPTDWTLFGTKGYMSPAVTTQEANEYLVLDLGKVRSVNYLTAYSSIQADKNGRAAGFPQDFTVETSEDGTAWTVQCEQTGYESPVVATAATFNFAPAQARYIKLNATKLGTASRTNPGRYMLAISELETGLKTGSNTDLSEVVVDYDTNLMTAVEVLGHNENHDWNWLNQTGYGSANLFDNNPDTVVTTGGYYRQQIEVEGVYPWLSTNISQNGQNAEIAAIRIAVDAINQPVDFTIEISQSNDPGNTDWTVVHSETGFDWSQNQSAVFIFSPREAKKVRLHATKIANGVEAPGTGSDDGKEYALRVAEFAAFAPKSGSSEPAEIDYTTNLLHPGCVEGIFHNNPNKESYNYDEVGTFPLDALVDGNSSAYSFITSKPYQPEWLLGNGGSLSPWVEVRLSDNGSAVQLGAVRVAVRPRVVPNDFEIQTSVDGVTWKTVVNEDNYDWSEEKTAAMFTFQPLQAARLRFVAHNLEKLVEDESYYFQLSELEAYGVAQTISVDTSNDLLEPGCVSPIYQINGGALQDYTNYTYPLNNLVDDDVQTFISSDSLLRPWLAANGGELAPWVDVSVTDDGTAVTVGGVQISIQETYNKPVDFSILASEDGQNWTTCRQLKGYDWGETTSRLFTFAPVSASKLRIQVRDLDGQQEGLPLYFRLTELEAYAPTDFIDIGRVIYVQVSSSETCTPSGIAALHDNSDKTYAAEHAINGMYYDNLEHLGYAVPESFGLKNFKNTADIEINILRWWQHRIFRNSGVSADGTEIYLDTDWLTSLQSTAYSDRITWIENAYEFIDQPGEWYLNRSESKLYYKPDGSMDGKSATLPVTEQLLVFEGTENITFDGVKFEDTSWLTPNEIGYNDAQSGTYAQHNGVWGDVPGAIETHAAKNITITNSELRNLGIGGIRIGNGSSDCAITNSAIHDISSSGIFIGNNTGHNHGYCDPGTDVTGVVVRNNYITRTGLDIFGSSAICALYTSDTVIDHNEVCYTTYTGISLGWGWDWKNAPCSGNNTVSNNYIHDTGKTIHDGGSFYSLGLQEGTKVFGNYLHHHSDGLYDKDGGLYTDEGSTGLELYNNVVGDGVYWWQKIWTTNIKDCYWHDNFYSVNRSWDSGVNIRQENNTYVEGGDFSQYPAAQAIINNAGLTDPSVKDGVRMGIAEKHNVTLMQYPDGEAYYFEKPAGLLTFTIPSQIGNTQYDKLAHTANILMPESTDRTSLAGNFTMAPGFTCDKASGSRQNFTSPVVYTFTDGTDTIAWTVTVTCDVTADGPLVGTETTLDAAIAARSDWTQEPAEAENGGALFTPAKSFSAYIGDRIANDAILEFDVQSVLDGNDWTGYALRMQDPYSTLGTMYHIVFKQDAIELQKWVNGNRTMLIGTIEGYDPVYGDVENKFYTSDIRHSIKTGAIDVPTGVRLFLYIDGNKVFDVIDADDPITNDGFFGMYPMTHDMTLLPFSNIDTSPKPDPDPAPEPKPILPILPSGGQSAWKNPYQDVTDSSSYYEAVCYVTEKGLMNGTGASTFSPDAAMTRAMMVTILWRMEKEPAALKSNFTDLTADWYRTAVDWAAETGVVNGVGNGKFAPNATLSLEQLITILYRYAENKGYNVSKSASLDSFTDGSAVSAYARPAMQWAVGMNFLSGNTLTPGAPASRAQIAQVLMLFCKAYIK